MKALLGNEFVDPKGNKLTYEKAIGDAEIIAIYNSAHWCPPCRAFTPILATAFQNMVKEGFKIQIVFASCDKSQGQFDEYFGTMPWVAFLFITPIYLKCKLY